MSKSQVIEKLFRKHGALTVRAIQVATGFHPSVIRRYVKPPHYRPASCEWATRRWETTWVFCDQVCECGQPAWYYGYVMMSFSNVRKEVTLLLCQKCAKISDDDIRVVPIP